MPIPTSFNEKSVASLTAATDIDEMINRSKSTVIYSSLEAIKPGNREAAEQTISQLSTKQRTPVNHELATLYAVALEEMQPTVQPG